MDARWKDLRIAESVAAQRASCDVTDGCCQFSGRHHPFAYRYAVQITAKLRLIYLLFSSLVLAVHELKQIKRNNCKRLRTLSRPDPDKRTLNDV